VTISRMMSHGHTDTISHDGPLCRLARTGVKNVARAVSTEASEQHPEDKPQVNAATGQQTGAISACRAIRYVDR
jgi:hypothetical protein